MKKIKLFALIGAVALTSSLAFTSCNNAGNVEEEVGSGVREEVKTQFSISMPTVNGKRNAPRRMQGTNVQENDGDFLGMEGMYLFPFSSSATAPAEPIAVGEEAIGNRIDLESNSIGAAGLDKINESNQKAKYYANVSIPIGTKSFLFYAHSPEAGTAPHFEQGTLTTSGLTTGKATVNTIYFDPTAITGTDALAGNAVGDKLVGYLNSIASATGWDAADPASELGKLYKNFTLQNANFPYFSAASENVKAAVQDVYASVFPWSDDVSNAIKTAIKAAGYASDTDNDGNLEFDASLNGFPANINLPAGAVILQCTGTPKVFAFASTTVLKNANLATPGKLAYPTSLYYRTNSIIRTSNSSHKSDYDTQSTWTGLLGTYTDNTGVVARATRSVAIEYPIQYAVARFEVTVKTKDVSTLDDNVAVLVPGEVAVPVPTPAAGYQLTGVIVGGQKRVDYQFHQIASGGMNYTGDVYSIYDNDVQSVYAKQGAADGTNHTLVLETPAGDDIYVALEFQNASGRDFYGKDGIISDGCKFYLVAKLNASEATTTGTQVFKQDYVTKANFTINDLKSAYNTIPDLRTSELELGMSVNLKWETGHTFEISTWE